MNIFVKRTVPLCLLLYWILVALGCGQVTQVQYFEAVGNPDPTTGVRPRAFYRMTIKGDPPWLGTYKMRAAYVSSTTLDTFDGRLPVIPDADLSNEQRADFVSVRATMMETVKERADALRARANGLPAEEFEAMLQAIARQAWFASLSDADVISIGQSRTTDPFEFRKLVFYASASNLRLQDYDAQINSAVEKASALAAAFRGPATRPATRPTTGPVTNPPVNGKQPPATEPSQATPATSRATGAGG